MAKYFCTGVWTGKDKVITHLLLHEDLEIFFSSGKKYTVAAVVELLESQNKVITRQWDYNKGNWRDGSPILAAYFTNGNPPYVRSHPDAKTSDNLDNILVLNSMIP
ncbi:DUF3892 domain-containing protein [Flavihumibacter petaseus]|uniref:DUF3892 domain-containing protein n=1 Tax=Flavihumibacter petaseus NBRC 106054 TaxID=1220578 RepID=A0A0E9N292_9BACT|nr:DUF3892 domain-containing protein [Flavihumibacter petaseus]GAO43786.1 hypothetical protein FPE01S_02_08920 [Flavihumibacter petaseus NBRC 106054]